MSAPSPAPVPRITRLGDAAGGPLVGAFAAGSLAEVTHLPAGIASSRTELIDLAPGHAITRPPATADLLVHVVAGTISALDPGDGAGLQAGPGDTLLVPAGLAVRAVADGGPAQLLLVRGG